ncbi:trimeric intracellular cation channel family protein [Patescibacteria group bacterium]|nr:trimeric intracellular cation channel family protein [Patescibacteria group bacterium]
MIIFIMDLIGTFTFSLYGATIALRKSYDIFGIIVCAFLTAVGGGTIRDMIMNKTPFYFFQHIYLYTILMGVIMAIVLFKLFPRLEWFIQMLDAIGLVAFAYIGMQKALLAHLGITAAIFFAPLTAAGGGFLRDIAMNRTPAILYTDFYAEPAIIFSVIYALSGKFVTNPVFLSFLMLAIFTLRMIAVRYNFIPWIPHKNNCFKYRKTNK